MLKNYLKISWRNLTKNKVFSLINVFGLAIGIMVCIMICIFIVHEFSFDRFHKNGDNIYRVMRSFTNSGVVRHVPWVSPPYATALKNDYPDIVKNIVRIEPSNDLIAYGNKSFNEKKILLADTNFFNFFSFPLLEGDPSTALKDPGSVVLTETTARKYFGSADPLGKVVQIDKKQFLKVTGVAKDIPGNSHLDFDLVIPLSTHYGDFGFDMWPHNRLFTYVMLNDHSTAKQLGASLPAFMQKYMGSTMATHGMHFTLSLTPLYDIYFEPATSDAVRHDDKNVVYIFLSVAILILLIACINFINLSTIRAVERSKEVGIRKVMGAIRNSLMRQFIGESILLTTLACIIAVGLLLQLFPLYNSLLGNILSFTREALPVLLALPVLIIVIGLLAGIYPAAVLSGFTPIQSLKGKLKLGKSGSFFRQTLVVVQFSISVLLIVGAIVIMRQMSYVKNKDLGYDKSQTVIVPLDNWDIFSGEKVFKNILEAKGNIEAVSVMSGEPGGFFDGNSFKVEGKGDRPWQFNTEFTDFNFVRTLGIKIMAGRGFSRQFSTDSTDAAIINQTAATELGFNPGEAIGKWIQNISGDSLKRQIIGVVQDFNFSSLKQKISPLVITPGGDNRVALVRLKAGNIHAGIATVEDAYKQVASAYPFEYTFLDQKFEELYKSDLRQQTILSLFSALAIFIACMGLFGLASFTAAKRIKEIGIRKVLGSSVQGIVLLLSGDLLKPVLLGIIIGTSVGYVLMNHWLQNFVYHISLQWWIFAAAGGLTIAIALITVSFKTIRAAASNPTKSLRSE